MKEFVKVNVLSCAAGMASLASVIVPHGLFRVTPVFLLVN
jgi:hypothetical protein